MELEGKTNVSASKEEKPDSNGSKNEKEKPEDKLGEEDKPVSAVSNIVTPASGSALGSLLAMTALSSNSMLSIMGLPLGLGEEERIKPRLDPEHVELYKKAFDDFDMNKDGTISTGVRRYKIKYIYTMNPQFNKTKY